MYVVYYMAFRSVVALLRLSMFTIPKLELWHQGFQVNLAKVPPLF